MGHHTIYVCYSEDVDGDLYAPARAFYSVESAKDFYGKQAIADEYQTIADVISDPEMAKVFGQYTRDALANENNYWNEKRTRKYDSWAKQGYGDMTDEEAVKFFNDHERRNYKLVASGNEASFYGDVNEKLRPFDGPGGFWERAQKIDKPDGTKYTRDEALALHKKLETEAPTLSKAFNKLLLADNNVCDMRSLFFHDL